jgi:HSP20 family protein
MNLVSRFGGRIWDPWREIGEIQREMSRLFSQVGSGETATQRAQPPVNLYANENELVLTLEVPGIDPANVDVTVTGEAVTVRGQRPGDDIPEGAAVHRRERPMGEFVRTVKLPYEVDPGKTEASYRKGILAVKMGRPDSHKPRKINVHSA